MHARGLASQTTGERCRMDGGTEEKGVSHFGGDGGSYAGVCRESTCRMGDLDAMVVYCACCGYIFTEECVRWERHACCV